MSYLPSGMPLPDPSAEDWPYWEACQQRRLVIRFCNACRQFFHPPAPSCAHCGSTDLDWKQVSGNGTVFSYTVAHHASHKILKGALPYNIVVVLLDDADDVRLVSNLVDTAAEDLRIGLPVTIHWDEVDSGRLLPRFRRTGSSTAGASREAT